METKNAICRGQARTLEDAVETWKPVHDEAMEACDVDAVVEIYLKFVAFLLAWQEETWEKLRANRLSNVQKRGRSIQTWLAKAVDFTDIEEGVREIEAKGYTVDKADEFRRIVRDVEQVNQDFSKRWPRVDEEKLSQSIADEKQGVRRRPAKEVFDELRRRVR